MIIKKLMALGRLKKHGFRFVGWHNGKLEYPDHIQFICNDYYGCGEDLDLLFGGEE